MEIETVEYQTGNLSSFGYLAYDNNNTNKRPGVLVAHAWRGQDNFAKEKARQLAELGYVGFAVDIYGEGLEVETNEAAAELMIPLFCNRRELRRRIVSAFAALKKHPLVDADKIAAIGFCFGGLTVIELLRSGSELKAVVSFHGLLGDQLPMGPVKATREPAATALKGQLLILHGHEDPLVSDEDISNIQKEFTEAGIQWEMDIYSHTVHAFTNPQLNDPESGLAFQSFASARSWQSMINFLKEAFST